MKKISIFNKSSVVLIVDAFKNVFQRKSSGLRRYVCRMSWRALLLLLFLKKMW